MIYILVVNRKEQYLVDKTNADIASSQFVNNENLNFTRMNHKNLRKLSIMGIKFSYVTHFEVIEGDDYDEPGQKSEGLQ